MSNAKVTKIEKQIADLQVKLEAAKVEAAAEAARTNIAVGAEVTFKAGRAETARELTGKVLASVEGPQGKVLKVLVESEYKVYDVLSSRASVVGHVDTTPGTTQSDPESVAAAVEAANELGVDLNGSPAVVQSADPVDVAGVTDGAPAADGEVDIDALLGN